MMVPDDKKVLDVVKRYWMLVTKMVLAVTNILKFHQHIASPTSVTNMDVIQTLVASIS